MNEPNPPDRPRLDPRPLDRPPVDGAEAAAFGRPHGVEGAFDKLYTPGTSNGSKVISRPPAPESLAEAFGRPPGADDIVLQRPVDDSGRPAGPTPESALWSKTADPWRDPGAAAVLGGPALNTEDEGSEEERPPGAMLSLPEVLFGRRVKPVALGLLGAICLLIGAVGGLAGWGIASTGNALTGSAT